MADDRVTQLRAMLTLPMPPVPPQPPRKAMPGTYAAARAAYLQAMAEGRQHFECVNAATSAIKDLNPGVGVHAALYWWRAATTMRPIPWPDE
jgi:hypothetical protein